ncbi:hypothetical protein RR48_13287 [Papilio machaon]|uniref:Uncharacterized protein n=1 Tax=Papilio machaon TaxID=76193 RepID=A0A194QVU3_PAPMA|nr:hypothetical protein RR48_13287 [Papilio machaon]
MGGIRKILRLIFFLLCLKLCCCNENWLDNIFEVGTGEKRSMSDAVLDFLDHVFPKDDSETSIMKEIFTMFAEDGPPGLHSGLSALEYLMD